MKIVIFSKQFKALESMAEQVKPEGSTTHATSSSNKPEKIATKPRGSGSPFKCIGLGLAQQIKSEKVEELDAARQRIEELESLAVCRQKEVAYTFCLSKYSVVFNLALYNSICFFLSIFQIFSLNARLAAAESMTHDVIRDLLGVKLDMTTYVVRSLMLLLLYFFFFCYLLV